MTAHKEDAGTSRRSSLASTGGQPTLFDAEEYESQSRIRNSKLFDSTTVKSFAMYFGDDIRPLVATNSTWQPVDVLILKFSSLRDLHLRMNTDRDPAAANGEDQASDAEPKTPRADRRKSIASFKSLKFARNRSFGSVKSLKGMLDEWRGKSSNSAASEFSVPASVHEAFEQTVVARTQHILAAVDLRELQQEYTTSRSAGSSFVRYVVQHIMEGLTTMPSPISGFLLMGIKELSRTIPRFDSKLKRIINYLNGEAAKEYAKALIFFDFVIAWDTFRDHVNGFVLSNMYFDREGKRKILFGPRRTKIAALVKQLSVEISLRTDFMVLQSHAIPPAQISAAILRAYITWASVNGFIAWTTPDPTYQVLNDIKTMDRIVIPDDGIFEIAMQPEVIACKEMVYTRIGELTAAKYQPVISSRAWARVKGIPTLAYDLREAWEVAESKETWIGYLTELGGRPTKPLPPSTDIIQTDDSDFQIPRWEEAVHQPIPCVNNFGVDTYGTPRRREVYETLSLSMLELLDKKLLASAKFNVDLVKSNDTHPPLILPDYANLLKTLEGIVHEPTPATQWLLSCTAKAETVTGIWELLEGLKHGRYHVWLPVNVAFILSNESLPYTPVSGIASKRGEDLHFFVAQSVPSYAEVVVHLYFKYAYEWSTSRCIVAEGLIRAQESGSSERVIPISRRLCFQVEDSCPSELLSIIRDSDRVLKDVHDNRALKGRERAYLSEVNKYLFQLAEFYLMEESEYVSRQRQALKAYYIPKNLFEKRMLAYINQCTLNFGGDQSLAAAARWVHEELALRPVTEKTTSDDATDSYMLCYVFRAMWKAIQRVAFEDLLIQLQDTNPFFLPESDQVAVSLEMVTSNPNLLAVFGIKSMIMAQEMHPLLRRIAIADMEKRPFVASHPLDAAKDVGGDVENPDAVELAEKNSVEEEDAPGVLITTRSVANSFIYVYFIFLDIALGLTLNSGIFSTFRMQVQVQETISLTLLIMFPIIGGMMNSVGRTVSYYFYQMSMPCMVAAFNRRLVASVIVFIAFGLLCGGITAYRTHDWILAALSWAYAVIFGIFMVLFAGLILLRNPDDYFFRGLGPQAICQACIFLIPNAFICRFVLDDDTNQYVLMSMYIGAMLVATSFMAYSYSTLATAYLEWPNTVTLPSKDEIVETYVRQHPRPVRVETESADAFGRRTRHWERSAAEWFGSQAENTLRKFQINPDPVFRKRLKNWYWEFQLMTWYIKRSGMKEPKVFSSEWDSTAKQAVEELRKKYTVEKLNRGGILFDNEISAIIFGFLYFLMIFSDRWSVLIATGRPLFLLVSTGAQKDYVQGVIGGTVFLLTASGLLELALSSIFAGHKDMKTVPLGSTKGPMEILLGQRRALQSIYATEARRFVMGMFGIWAVISGIMAAVAFSMQRHDLFWNYLLSSAGFVGLLLGLFNKLFVISMEATLSAFLAIGLILGTLISAFMVRHFDRTDYSTFALIISGWLFAIGCIASQALERMQNFYYGLHISPLLTTSGQREVGYPITKTDGAARDELVADLIAHRHRHNKFDTRSYVCDDLRERLKSTHKMLRSPGGHILCTAFRGLVPIIESLLADLESGALEIYRTQKPLKAGVTKYSAVSAKVDRTTFIFLAPQNPRLTDQGDLMTIVESVIHEYVECRDLPHSTACAAELVATPSLFQVTSDWAHLLISTRLKHQEVDDALAEFLTLNTGNVMNGKADIDVKVDDLWRTKLDPEEKHFLISLAKAWWYIVSEVRVTARMPRSLEKLIDKRPKLLSRYFAFNPSFDLGEHICECILLSFVAENLRDLYSLPGSRTAQPDTHAHQSRLLRGRNWLRRRVDAVLDTRVALYLALTADEHFGAEITQFSAPIRWSMGCLYAVSRKMLDFAQDCAFYTDAKYGKGLMSMQQVLIREHHFDIDENDSSRLARVETFYGPGHTIITTFPDFDGIDRETGLITAERFVILGMRPTKWKRGNATPQSRAYYKPRVHVRDVAPQLVTEHILDGSGKVTKTRIYGYRSPEAALPNTRTIYEGHHDPTSDDSALQIEPLEVHRFVPHGTNAVVGSSLLILTAKNGVSFTVTAKYVYKNHRKPHIPERGIFTCISGEDWTWDITYSPSSLRPGQHPRFYGITIKRNNAPTSIHTRLDYSHPEHVRYETVEQAPGKPPRSVPTPSEILEDKYGLLARQPPLSFRESSDFVSYGLRAKKTKTSFMGPVSQIQFFARAYSTIAQREALWVAWRSGDIPAPFARDIDERLLRKEKLLNGYWWRRDFGMRASAQELLRSRKHLLTTELQLTDQAWTRTHLQLRYGDLHILGCGGDAERLSPEDDENQALLLSGKNETLPVMNLDSGTWPTGGGGVGSCRRDLIAGLPRIRWVAYCELGSADLVQKDYPIERHIDSIKYIPLWDLDFGTPNENLLRTVPYTQLQAKTRYTSQSIIEKRFVPLITKLVQGCMGEELHDVDGYERMFVELHEVVKAHDWVTLWNNKATQKAWIEGWLNTSWRYFEEHQLQAAETPTLREVEMLFDLISRLLMALSMELPKVPVIHSSHHGIQAIVGVIAKKLNGCSLIVWDHGILWRERLFGLCFDEGMPRFAQIIFAGFNRLVAKIVFVRADYITPCTSIQNVDWEAWIGGGKDNDDRLTRSLYRRINPVLNGMNVDKFRPDFTKSPSVPTAVMLSHISPVKDVMNAINATKIIVREFHLESYQLHIYGSPQKDPPYTALCLRAIANYGLEKNVFLKGLGSPSAVLPTGHVFVNSSITEGLPLALGEAGLCGLPVVCTDVGGSREVIRDPTSKKTFGWVVPPSRPRQLALGQLRVLAMTDGLEGETASLNDFLTADGEMLCERIMAPRISQLRTQLGLGLRNRIMSVFSINRYWREHEQVLWLGELHQKVKQRSLHRESVLSIGKGKRSSLTIF